MIERERFLATLVGSGADRFPFFDLEPAEETVERWRREGLPPGTSVPEHFRLETHSSIGVVLRSAPFYEQASDLLSAQNSFQRHYDLDDPDRFPKDLVQRCRRLREEGRVVYVDASGGGLFQMLGVGDWESLIAACVALKNDSSKVRSLLEKTTDFHCRCLEFVLPEVSVDYASLYEPIATNTGPLVSPEMFREFALPVYQRVIEMLDRHGVTLRILSTTGGDLSSLLTSFLDAGINGLWISNIMSSRMEYSTLRREYGSDIALIGGIDSTALTADDDTLRRVIQETVPPLLETGHYLPCLDDRPRSNVPFARYKLYREILAEIAHRP